MPTVALVNPKGGSGKSTVAVHLAVAAHRDGVDTALVDADPQGSVLDWHRRTPENYDGPDVLGLGEGRAVAPAVRRAASELVVMDSPARLDDRTGRVLSNADLALVPVRPSGVDLWGVVEFLDVLTGHVERGLPAAFVGSQRDVRTNLSDELDDAATALGLPLLDGFTLRVSYARSLSEGRTVLDGSDDTAREETRALLSDTYELLTERPHEGA